MQPQTDHDKSKYRTFGNLVKLAMRNPLPRQAHRGWMAKTQQLHKHMIPGACRPADLPLSSKVLRPPTKVAMSWWSEIKWRSQVCAYEILLVV